jgi:hypothetical protein
MTIYSPECKARFLVKCAASTFMAEKQAKCGQEKKMHTGTKQLGTAAVAGTTGTAA